jgi:hypothetical protein
MIGMGAILENDNKNIPEGYRLLGVASPGLHELLIQSK